MSDYLNTKPFYDYETKRLLHGWRWRVIAPQSDEVVLCDIADDEMQAIIKAKTAVRRLNDQLLDERGAR